MTSIVTAPDLTVCELSCDGLSPEFLLGWERLGRNAIEPNPFLEPQFVLSQSQHLSSSPLAIWAVVDSQQQPVLLTVVRQVAASARFPFPHLTDDTSAYRFQGGMLLDQRVGRRAVIAFLEHLKTTRFRHGMILDSLCIDSPFSEQLYTSAALTGFQVQLQAPWSRASLNLQEIDRTQLLETCCSKSRRKSLFRARARLEKRGPVEFRLIQNHGDRSAAVARFIDLEKRGWKLNSGTAIGCDPAHLAFFEELTSRFSAEHRLLFGELLVGGEVIASTCNLIAGQTLFAFKIGWNPDYRDGSPGAWAEIELVKSIARERPEITLLNSCSNAGSYLDRLWPHRIAMGHVILSQSHRALLFNSVHKTLRTVKRLVWRKPGAEQEQASGE